MDNLLEVGTLREIFYNDETVGSFYEYAKRVRRLHHHFLEARLIPDQPTQHVSADQLLGFANDADFLATHYTNPLVIERTEDLPVEDVPSRQVVQDALSLAGNIFEFLADIVTVHEEVTHNNQNSRIIMSQQSNEEVHDADEVYQRLGRSSLLYLKSALCYGLGQYEPRTRVIFQKLLNKLNYPQESLSIHNHQQWADYLLCALLGRNLFELRRVNVLLAGQTLSLREDLRRRISTTYQQYDSQLFSSRSIATIETSLSLIDAFLLCAKGFLEGDSVLIERAQASLSKAIQSVYQLGDYELMWILRTLSTVLTRMWADSPWMRLEGIINRRSYIRTLVEEGIVTLWSSQVAAIEMKSTIGTLTGGYLDPRVQRVIINMPTSAGKTLIAELAIAREVFGGGRCVYVAPSRALCDQVAADLAARLTRFGIGVTTVVSDNDIIGYDRVLFRKASVIIVTPEKLSYLFRQRDEFINDSGLFIFDELHNIGKSDRGWIYEQLISLLIQHPITTTAKMLFLSAVMPNHLTVQEWVDPDQLHDTISEMWQPTRVLKGAVRFQRIQPNRNQREVMLPGTLVYVRDKKSLNSPLRIHNFIQSRQVLKEKQGEERSYLVRDAEKSDDHIVHALVAAERFARLGSVLVYCPMRLDATSFCKRAITQNLSFAKPGQHARYQELLEFLKDRLPENHMLLETVVRGVAFHHAGLPRDVRNEIELAYREGLIHILAATTTLVEGVNFPVKTLILSDYCQRRRWIRKERMWTKPHPLSKSDFRNISGRAGRALYETEGHVILIQSIVGYPYGAFDTDFEDYLALDSDSPEVSVTSTMADNKLLNDLSQLVDDVDNYVLSEEELLFEMERLYPKGALARVVEHLHAFVLLLQDQNMVGDDEEAFIQIFQGTFLGTQIPDQAPYIFGAFAHRSARAINSYVEETDRALFAQTGLKIKTCYRLMQRIRNYWKSHGRNIREFLTHSLNPEILHEIAKVIYGLGDNEVDPQKVALYRDIDGRSPKKQLDDAEFFADWISSHNRPDLLRKHFRFILDESWRAEEYISYTQQTLGYRAPWTLSAFWIFSKAFVQREYGIDLINTSLGRELILLPAYAKFGVSTPAAALFCTLGVNPAQLARQLGDLYESKHSIKLGAKYNYPQILEWLLTVEPLDLEDHIASHYIRHLIRTLTSLKPLQAEHVIQENEKSWEARFAVAGLQYYGGESIIPSIRLGDNIVLRHEPNNRYNPNAVEVLTEQGMKLGYVPRYLAAELASRVQIQPIKARISQVLRSAPLNERVRVYCTQD